MSAAADTPKPVAFLHEHPKHGKDLGFQAITAADREYGYTETPLYAHPAAADTGLVERLTAERDEFKELVQRNYNLWFAEKTRAEAAEQQLGTAQETIIELKEEMADYMRLLEEKHENRKALATRDERIAELEREQLDIETKLGAIQNDLDAALKGVLALRGRAEAAHEKIALQETALDDLCVSLNEERERIRVLSEALTEARKTVVAACNKLSSEYLPGGCSDAKTIIHRAKEAVLAALTLAAGGQAGK